MDEIDTKIDVALAPFTARRMPMLWWIGPVTRPAGLGARLEAHGLTHAEDVPGMALDLVSFNPDLPTPPDLEIQQVADEGTLMEWSRVVATCFDVPPEHVGQVCDLFAAAGYGEARISVG